MIDTRNDIRDGLIQWWKGYGQPLSLHEFNTMLEEAGLDAYKPIHKVRLTLTLDVDVEELQVNDKDDIETDGFSLTLVDQHGHSTHADTWNADLTVESIQDIS